MGWSLPGPISTRCVLSFRQRAPHPCDQVCTLVRSNRRGYAPAPHVKNAKMVHIVRSGAYLPFEVYSPRQPLKPTVGSNDCEPEVVGPDDRPRGGKWAPISRSLKLVFSVDGKCVFAASFHGDVHEPSKKRNKGEIKATRYNMTYVSISRLWGRVSPKYRIRKENQRLGNRGGEIIGG
jgi:hypothetical protein